MGIRAANDAFEKWLAKQLGDNFVKDDIKIKHAKMSKSAFAFLRATYWRWAEKIFEVCPNLREAPKVLAVGDIHLENFGTWTDREGRIVWGVNDFDEAAEMPYILDIVRLASSAVLAATPAHLSRQAICTHILEGYRFALKTPEALVLDRDHLWLRKSFIVDEIARKNFWRKIDKEHRAALANKNQTHPSSAWLKVFARALPDRSISLTYWPHTAGTGSLGRRRWLGYSFWRSGPLLREAKALVPSAWVRAQGGKKKMRLNDIARGRYRAPDPWYEATGNVLVRRLSPNNRKLNLEKGDSEMLLDPHLLHAMGRDLAAIHLGTRGVRADLHADFSKRRHDWFRAQVDAASKFVENEYAEWKKSK